MVLTYAELFSYHDFGARKLDFTSVLQLFKMGKTAPQQRRCGTVVMKLLGFQ